LPLNQIKKTKADKSRHNKQHAYSKLYEHAGHTYKLKVILTDSF